MSYESVFLAYQGFRYDYKGRGVLLRSRAIQWIVTNAAREQRFDTHGYVVHGYNSEYSRCKLLAVSDISYNRRHITIHIQH